jgi:hypothetical protein
MQLSIASIFDTTTAARTIDTEGGVSRPESHAHRFRIVVLDTVMALLVPHLSGISSQGNVTTTPRAASSSLHFRQFN